MRLPGPLWRRAALRLAGEGVSGVLVVASFGLLAAAAASRAPFGEAAENAALATVLAGVPPGAPASSAAVVRVAGGSPSANGLDQRERRDQVARIPGLTPPVLSGLSVIAEITRGQPVTMSVRSGRRTEPVRLGAVEDPKRFLVAAATAPAASSGRPAVWLGEPTARAVGATAGDVVTLHVQRRLSADAVAVTVAGVYRVADDGRRAADPPSSSFWLDRRANLPRASAFAALPSPLVVADVPTAQGLANELGDKLLWSIDAALDPRVRTLPEVSAAAAGFEALGLDVRDPASGSETTGALTASVASGLPSLAASARTAAAATRVRTDSLARAAVVLAAAVVLGAAGLTVARRRGELALGATLGIGPVRSAGLAAIEHLPAALVGGAAGLAAGWAVVAAAGPPGPVTGASLGPALTDAAVAGLLAVLGVAALTGLAAAVAARPQGRAPRRRLPWELLLGVAAVTATAALVTTEDDGRPEGALALLVPLLLVAGVAAVGGRLALLALGRALSGSRAAAVTGRARGQGRGARWRAARGLALRRLASPGGSRAAVIAVLATGTGLLVFGLAAADSTRLTVDDRVAVAAGAQATASVPASWALDPGAPVEPPPDPTIPPEVLEAMPVPGVRNPPLGAGRTVTWRTKVGDPIAYGSVELLVVDPAGFDAAALWGRGPALAQARRLLAALRDDDRSTLRRLDAGATVPVPVLAVGHPALTTGERVSVLPGEKRVAIEVVGTLDAFPSLSSLPMIVAPADSMFRSIPREDPRVQPPRGSFARPQAFPLVSLWSSGGGADAASVLAAHDLGDVAVVTADSVRRQPELQAAVAALGYQRALGWAAALVALVAFTVHADRQAAAGRLSDLFLVRVGLGARGVRRARLLELTGMAAAAAVLAIVAVALLRPIAPRLLEPQRAAATPFVLAVGGTVAALAVGVVVAGVVAAAGAATLRQRRGTPEEVLRDA
jgi:hypothetical protein